jgi:serine protease Do
MDHPNENMAQTNAPQEVVLRYEAPVTPIVERYVQPTPLPGRKNAPPSPSRRRKGLKIFLFCMLGLIVLSGAITALWYGGVFDRYTSYDDGRFEHRGEPNYYDNSDDHGETTIKRLPNTDKVKLRYSETHGKELSIQEIYQKVNPSTVTVLTGMSDGSAMVGTGVIFTEDGYILTNAHVIAGGSECYVVLDTGENHRARLLGLDEEKDLAVIKISAKDLPAAEFGDSDALTVGDPVYAIGNPLGVELRGTLTDGIVSAINRDVYVDGVTMTLIQTNAALNNGNSGGPLINVYGQVVGINTMKMGSSSTTSVEGLGFAIPIASTAYMINDLIAYGEIHGEVMIGVSVQTVPVTLDSGETALLIMDVTPGGPGDEAGLREGDLLLKADGEALTKSADLLRIRRRHDAGETLTLTYERNGKRSTVDVILRESTS